ncbi:MAG: hypothetical protein ACYDHY_17575 [Acidiferrobacterales bacterium]
MTAPFLEKLRTEGEILWTFFTRNKRGEWTVKPHARTALANIAKLQRKGESNTVSMFELAEVAG